MHEAAALTALSCARASGTALQDLTSTAAHTAWLQLLAPLMPQRPGPAHQQQEDSSNPENSAGAAAQELARDAADPPAAPTECIGGAAAVPAGNDNVCLLVKFVAMQSNRLQKLMDLLQSPAAQQSQGHPQPPAAPAAAAVQQDYTAQNDAGLPPFTATEQQAVLLHIVALEAAAVPAASQLPGLPAAAAGAAASLCEQQQCVGASTARSPGSSWLQYVVDLLRVVWAAALATAGPTAGVCSRPTATAHVLEATLHVSVIQPL